MLYNVYTLFSFFSSFPAACLVQFYSRGTKKPRDCAARLCQDAAACRIGRVVDLVRVGGGEREIKTSAASRLLDDDSKGAALWLADVATKMQRDGGGNEEKGEEVAG